MKKMNICLLVVLSLLVLNSCSILPSPANIEIHYYDIGFPSRVFNPGIGININPFSGGVGDETRMVFRDSSNNVRFDAYNRWSFSPAKLVQRYFALSFDDKKISPVACAISGEILRFDGNLATKNVNITLKVDVISVPESKLLSSEIYQSSIRANAITATAFAEAMQKAIAGITEKVAMQQIKPVGKK